MSGGCHLPTAALRIVLAHHRPEVLRRQLSDIDEAMYDCEFQGVVVPPHYARMRGRAHALRSIEYCEDLIMHLRTAAVRAYEMRASDGDSAALCDRVIEFCVMLTGEDDEAENVDNRTRRRAAMRHVEGLMDLLVGLSRVRPWARAHLDIVQLANWYQRRCSEDEPRFYEFRALLTILMTRTE